MGTVYVDMELKVIHSRQNCSGARVPRLYGTLRNTYCKNEEHFDRMIAAGGKECLICKKPKFNMRSGGYWR